MQGRAGKAPKREMVIESPQQYKCLAEIEAEVEAGSQVAVVSFALCLLSHRRTVSCCGSCLLKRTFNLFNQAFYHVDFLEEQL